MEGLATTVIFIIGNKNDIELESLIVEKLASTYQINYIKDKEVYRIGSGYELLVIDTESVLEINLGECIIVMKSDAVLPSIELPERCIVIANSENKKLLGTLEQMRTNVITCGSNIHDSVSYSSLTSDGIVISLNREIIAFSGKKIEPLEIPAFFSSEPENVYNSLAFTALRLVLDDFNSEIGLLY